MSIKQSCSNCPLAANMIKIRENLKGILSRSFSFCVATQKLEKHHERVEFFKLPSGGQYDQKNRESNKNPFRENLIRILEERKNLIRILEERKYLIRILEERIPYKFSPDLFLGVPWHNSLRNTATK